MALITGRDASVYVNGTALHAKEWRISSQNKVKAQPTSTSSGWDETAEGCNSWSGSFQAALEDGSLAVGPTLVQGKTYSFIGYTDAAKTHYASGTVRIKDIEDPVAVDGDELFATVNFVGDGALVRA